MNGPLISDIITAADIPSFPWGRALFLGAVPAFIVAFCIGVVGVLHMGSEGQDEPGEPSTMDVLWGVTGGIVLGLISAGAVLALYAAVSESERSTAELAARVEAQSSLSSVYDIELGYSRHLPIEPFGEQVTVRAIVGEEKTYCSVSTKAERYLVTCVVDDERVMLTPKGTP